MRNMILIAAFCSGGTVMLGQQNAPAPALTPAQRQEMERITQAAAKETKTQAESGVLNLGEIAKRIDRNLLSETPDDALHQKLSNELAEALASVVRTTIYVKLNTVRDLAKVLSSDQKRLVLAELDKTGANPDLEELLRKVFPEPRK
jgi:hypothetical protein